MKPTAADRMAADRLVYGKGFAPFQLAMDPLPETKCTYCGAEPYEPCAPGCTML